MSNLFSSPKSQKTKPPAELPDEEQTAKQKNRDNIRRRQSGGRSSTIMSDTLG